MGLTVSETVWLVLLAGELEVALGQHPQAVQAAEEQWLKSATDSFMTDRELVTAAATLQASAAARG